MPITFKRERDPNTWDDIRYVVTLFRPHAGLYPHGTISVGDALFHADEDIVFMCTHGRRWAADKDLPYSEVDWLEPEVVRFAGAMMMSAQFEDVYPRFYPEPQHKLVIDAESLELAGSEISLQIKEALLRAAEDPSSPTWVKAGWNLCTGKKAVLFDADRLELPLVPHYYENTSVEDYILMRTIQALIKSDMLGHHHEFQEEGCIQTFIAMEACHQMVLEGLKEMGLASPTAQDAGDWLHQTFDEPLGVGIEGMKFFEEFYKQRIQTVHPRSRFGDSPIAPLMVDDRYHLRESLPSILAYMVLGGHKPSFLAAIARSNMPVPNNCSYAGRESGASPALE